MIDATVVVAECSRLDPSTISRLAGHALPHPLVRGFQNNIAAALLATFHA